MYNKAMKEGQPEEYKTPWGMPQEIFWEYRSEDAELGRLQWVLDNKPELALDEIQRTMPFTSRTLAKAGLTKSVKNSGAETKFLG